MEQGSNINLILMDNIKKNLITCLLDFVPVFRIRLVFTGAWDMYVPAGHYDFGIVVAEVGQLWSFDS